MSGNYLATGDLSLRVPPRGIEPRMPEGARFTAGVRAMREGGEWEGVLEAPPRVSLQAYESLGPHPAREGLARSAALPASSAIPLTQSGLVATGVVPLDARVTSTVRHDDRRVSALRHSLTGSAWPCFTCRGSCRTRTCHLRFWRPVLYLMS